MANQIALSEVKGYALTRPNKQVALSEVKGYALTTPTNPVGVRQITGYVMGVPAAALGLRALTGYVMGPSLKPFPKGVTGQTAVLQLIVKKAKTANRPTSDFTIDPPAVLDGDANWNTTVKAYATAQSGLSGSKTFRYNRLSIDRITNNPINFAIDSSTTIYALLPAINAYTGMTLTTDDVVDGPIAASDQFVTLTAKSTSWFFIPGSTISLGKTLPALSTKITGDTLNW